MSWIMNLWIMLNQQGYKMYTRFTNNVHQTVPSIPNIAKKNPQILVPQLKLHPLQGTTHGLITLSTHIQNKCKLHVWICHGTTSNPAYRAKLTSWPQRLQFGYVEKFSGPLLKPTKTEPSCGHARPLQRVTCDIKETCSLVDAVCHNRKTYIQSRRWISTAPLGS